MGSANGTRLINGPQASAPGRWGADAAHFRKARVEANWLPASPMHGSTRNMPTRSGETWRSSRLAMASHLIAILVAIMLTTTLQTWAMDTPPGMRLEDVRGPFGATCECSLFDWSHSEPQRYGKALGCRCKTVYGNRVSSQLWLRACKNGTVLSDPRTGKLQCLPDVGFTVGFNRYCELRSDVKDVKKIAAICWTKPSKSGFGLLSDIDLMTCGGMRGPPRQLIVDATSKSLTC